MRDRPKVAVQPDGKVLVAVDGGHEGEGTTALGGADEVRGLAGPDLICGGKGFDKLFGGSGRDEVRQ